MQEHAKSCTELPAVVVVPQFGKGSVAGTSELNGRLGMPSAWEAKEGAEDGECDSSTR